ncbi:dTMP kinase [Actinosynnema pretiosum]|nr:dTMP kinase [Actinosynnema pretiosum]
MVEGLDGAGKRTLTGALTAELESRGARVTTGAFPRYGRDVHADLVRAALYGELGPLVDEVRGMALLYALDRRGAREELRADLASHDVVLLDRYIASGAAYGAARLHQGPDGEFVAWVRALEVDRFELPLPDLQLLLRVPAAVAEQRAAHREATETDRGRDVYESDGGLQRRCGEVYDGLAAASWLSPWRAVDGSVPAAELGVAAIADLLG